MKNNIIINLILMFFFSYAVSFASDSKQINRCGTTEYMAKKLNEDPTLKLRMDQIEKFTNLYIQKAKENRLASNTSGNLLTNVTIPVVFHVVYNTAAQNVSDAMINAQLATLNADFAGTNADISGLPSVFSSIKAGNTGIQFCLAKRDPCGFATTGIIRKSTTLTSFNYLDDNVKFTLQGGDNAWDATKYLNIWICNLSGGVLGYAQPPNLPASTDGVVLKYTTLPGGLSPYNKGRTATHEVGHWLNLKHIWGDDNGTCTGSDLVTDTPNQEDKNFGCPAFPHITCSNGPSGDLFQNYMDYTDDACMFMFTLGQLQQRIEPLFQPGQPRASLLTSNGCVQPLAISMENAPNSICTTSGQQVYTLKNVPAGATVTWTANPNGIVSFPFGNIINPVTVQRVTNAVGQVTLTATVTNSNCNITPIPFTRIINVGLPYSLYPTNPVSPEAVMETGADEGPCNSQCYSPGGPTKWWNAPLAFNSTSETWQKTYSVPANYSFWSPGTNKIGLFFKAANQYAEFKRTLTNGCGSTIQYYCFGSTTTLCSGSLRSGTTTSQSIKIYPNPVTTNSAISIEIFSEDKLTKLDFEDATIQLIDSKDNIIFQKKGSKVSKESLEIPALSNGTYYLRVINKNGVQTEQIILKN